MNEMTFDSLTRNAAGSVSRRASLVTLGVAGLGGLATAVAGSFKAGARKNNPKQN